VEGEVVELGPLSRQLSSAPGKKIELTFKMDAEATKDYENSLFTHWK
jgi:hypothetical protein